MAANYLAIQGSSVSCGRKFSSAGLVDTKCRNRLSPANFSAVEFAKAHFRQQVEDKQEEMPAEESQKRERDDEDNDSESEGRPEKRLCLDEYF